MQAWYFVETFGGCYTSPHQIRVLEKCVFLSQVYHSAGPVPPDEGQPHRYGQLYILDTEQAAQERFGHAANWECDRVLMTQLHEYIANHNPYARSFKLMYEIVKDETEKARKEGRSAQPVRMVFEVKKNLDRRR